MDLISQLSDGKAQTLDGGGARARDNDGMSTPAVSESQFSTALRLERRRTERSKRPFLLMLADFQAMPSNAATDLDDLASALAAAARETDIVGWYRQNKVLGAIFTELGVNDRGDVLISVKQRVSAVIREKLGDKPAKKVNLSFHFFPEDHSARGRSAPGLHAKLYGGRSPKPVTQGLKRVIDVVGSLLLLIAFFPVLLLIGAIVKLTSRGPMLFRQLRIGQHGKEFTFLKFRSMYENSDAALHKEYVSHFIAGDAPVKESADGSSVYKVVDDPRVTPFGRFLRKTSLDELPQLINVLRGEMSLVGPRPPLPYEFDCYDVWHLRRIVEVKPGITGLWQVCGRSRTSFDEMVRLDLRYATHWSLRLDFMILARTPGVVLSGNGAY
jgi:lipopolysaccharide/colanic/teichoic acid biosynthesis glycosyltransferase